jgi:hypothetical protein
MTIRTEAEEKRIKERSKEIRAEYDYLDSIPTGGWIWEFLRRSESYRNAYQGLEQIVKEGIEDDKVQQRLLEFEEYAREGGLWISRSRPVPEEQCEGYLPIRIPLSKFMEDIRKISMHVDDVHDYSYIPDPKRKLVDFQWGPFLAGMAPMQPRVIITPSAEMENQIVTLPATPRGVGGKSLFTIHESIKDIIIDKILKKDNIFSEDAPSPFQDDLPESFLTNSDKKIMRHALNEEVDKETVYVAISRRATHSELKKHLLSYVKTYLTPHKPRKHDPKWKHYLIVYDLRETSHEEITYEIIADLLTKAYPKLKTKKGKPSKIKGPFDARNVEGYHSNARKLIAGEYRKYLL